MIFFYSPSHKGLAKACLAKLCAFTFLLLLFASTNSLLAQCNTPETLDFSAVEGSSDVVNDINNADLTLAGGRVLVSRTFAGNATADEYNVHDFHLTGFVGPHVGVLNSADVNDHANLTFKFTNDIQGLSFRFLDLDRHDEVIVNAKYNGSIIPITASHYTFPGANPCPAYLDNNLFESTCLGTNLDNSMGNSIEGVIDFNFSEPVDELEFIFYHDSAAAGFIGGGSFTVASISACAYTPGVVLGDFDGDGIEDEDDLDDDNDGIPDAIEKDCENNTVVFDFIEDDLNTNPSAAINDGIGTTGVPYTVGDAVLTLDPPVFVGGAAQDEYQINNTHLNTTYAVRTGVDQTAPGPGQNVTTTYRLSEPVEDFCFFFNDLDRNDEVIINGKLQGTTVNLSTNDFTLTNTTPDPACPVWQGNNTWRSQCAPPAANLNDSDRGGIQICFPSIVDEIEIIFYDYTAGLADGTEGGSFSVSDFEVCTPVDTDGDGIPDYQDTDSDNDGCPDAAEACHEQPIDANGMIAGPYGENGLADIVETTPESGILNCTLIDADNDGIPAYIDEDESNCQDKDGDGVPDSQDADDDGDGIMDINEGACVGGPAEVVDFTPFIGVAGDLFSAMNNADLELGGCDMTFTRDFGGNAVPDEYLIDDVHLNGTFGPHIGVASSEGPGDFVRVNIDWACPIDNFCFLLNDLDRNDEMVVNAYLNGNLITLTPADYELLGNCAAPTGVPNTFESVCTPDNLNNSTDGAVRICFPGQIDQLEVFYYNVSTPAAGGSFTLAIFERACVPDDCDGDGIPNYCDLDSDNDGIPDVIDANGSIQRTVDSPNPTPGEECEHIGFEDANGDGMIDDMTDTDGDGLPDVVDPDNGGILHGLVDMDGDGIPDICDLDSDNDGIPDIIEAGGTDVNGDGMVDDYNPGTGTFTPAENGNGWSAIYDATEGGVPMPVGDFDGDGLADLDDSDSDNDGLPDLVEVGGIDANNDGYVDNFDDPDGDGWTSAYDGDNDNDGTSENLGNQLVEESLTAINATNNAINPDGTGGLNHLDLDSDDDDCYDTVEADTQNRDLDDDGIVGGADDGSEPFTDSDCDGMSDLVDPDSGDNDFLVNDNPFTDLYTNADSFPQHCEEPLPVELVSFSGFDNHCSVKLKWETATETNFNHFIVERSHDGTNFVTIEKIIATGNLAAGAKYNYTDRDIKPVNYYRLKIVDNDGTYDYSGIRAVKSKCFGAGDVTITDVYPNPVKDILFIQMTVPNAANDVTAYIHDELGRTVSQQEVSLTEGANLVEIKTNKLHAGSTYFLKIQSGAWMTEVQKFIKAE